MHMLWWNLWDLLYMMVEFVYIMVILWGTICLKSGKLAAFEAPTKMEVWMVCKSFSRFQLCDFLGSSKFRPLYFRNVHPRSLTASLPSLSFWVSAYFQGRFLLNFQGVNHQRFVGEKHVVWN